MSLITDISIGFNGFGKIANPVVANVSGPPVALLSISNLIPAVIFQPSFRWSSLLKSIGAAVLFHGAGAVGPIHA